MEPTNPADSKQNRLDKKVPKKQQVRNKNTNNSGNPGKPGLPPKTDVTKLTFNIINADVLTNKIAELRRRTSINDPDVIIVTEARPKRKNFKMQTVDFIIQGYTIFNINLANDIGRGMIIYCKQSLEATEILTNTTFKEILAIKIPFSSRKNSQYLTVVGIYNSPNSTEENENALHKVLHHLSRHSKHLMIAGDFNYKHINWETQEATGEMTRTNKLLDTLKETYLYQHVRDPTRCRADTEPSTLDLILTHNDYNIQNLQQHSPIGKSDHACLYAEYLCPGRRIKRPYIRYNYGRGKYTELNQTLQGIDWRNKLLNPEIELEAMYSELSSTLLELRDRFIPSRMIKGDNNRKPYRLSIEEQKAIKRKHRAWTRYMECMKNKNCTKETRRKKKKVFNQARNKVRSITRKAEKCLERDICAEAKKNQKRLWGYIHSKNKIQERIPDLYLDSGNPQQGLSSNDTEKANILADFFASVFTEEDIQNIPEVPTAEERGIAQLLDDIDIPPTKVEAKLKKLNINKSQGPDNIHPQLLRESRTNIAEPLSAIFRKSLATSTIPKPWKEGKITAIYKKGEKSKPANYRPVSLTSVVCKVMESIIRDSVLEHLTSQDLLSKQQYGFVSGRSTILQLLHVLEDWLSIIHNGGGLTAAYMDFQKAFDKVPHKRLILKCKSYGISGKTLLWIEDFLAGRTQQVMVNGTLSEKHEVRSGIPQGSVLGPMLFVIYINDLPHGLSSTTMMFADDTKIYQRIQSRDDSIKFQEDIKKLHEWSQKWQLLFHPDKCKVMHIGRISHAAQYKIGENEMKEVQSEKDLGVLFDADLSFKAEIQARAAKGHQMSGIIRRTFTHLDHLSFKRLFIALARPHLEYGAPIWQPYKKGDKELLEKVQRRATKQLPGLKDKSYDQRLRELQLPTLAFRRLRGDMIEVYKLFNKYTCKTEDVLKLDENQGRTRGNQRKLFKSAGHLEKVKNSFSRRVVHSWNSLPNEVVLADNLNIFKNRLDKTWSEHPLKFDWEWEPLPGQA